MMKINIFFCCENHLIPVLASSVKDNSFFQFRFKDFIFYFDIMDGLKSFSLYRTDFYVGEGTLLSLDSHPNISPDNTSKLDSLLILL